MVTSTVLFVTVVVSANSTLPRTTTSADALMVTAGTGPAVSTCPDDVCSCCLGESLDDVFVCYTDPGPAASLNLVDRSVVFTHMST